MGSGCLHTTFIINKSLYTWQVSYGGWGFELSSSYSHSTLPSDQIPAPRSWILKKVLLRQDIEHPIRWVKGEVSFSLFFSLWWTVKRNDTIWKFGLKIGSHISILLFPWEEKWSPSRRSHSSSSLINLHPWCFLFSIQTCLCWLAFEFSSNTFVFLSHGQSQGPSGASHSFLQSHFMNASTIYSPFHSQLLKTWNVSCLRDLRALPLVLHFIREMFAYCH